jgi:hypothetical protein
MNEMEQVLKRIDELLRQSERLKAAALELRREFEKRGL